jgi:hypothetical protein
MSYVIMHVNMTGLDRAEIDAFYKTAADLDLDVIELAPHLSVDPETTVLISTSLAALISKLAEMFGGDAAEKLWALLQRLLRRDDKKHAIEDRERRVTFVWDEHATQAGPVAVAAMIAIGNAINAIQDGTDLTWDRDIMQWRTKEGIGTASAPK